MGKLFFILLVFYMESMLVCVAEYFCNLADVNNAVDYLQGYTGTIANNVIFLASPWFSMHHETVLEEIHLSLSNQSNNQYIMSLVLTGNTSNVTKNFKESYTSFVIVPGFGDSTDVQNVFFDFPDHVTKDHLFIIILRSDFVNAEEIYKEVLNIISIHPMYISKFALNSHVYAIAGMNNKTLLFEIYQPCKDDDIIMRELTPLPHTEKSIKYVWKNRKDLSNCVIRVGYMNIKPLVMMLSNDNLMNPPSDIKLAKPKRRTLLTGNMKLYGFYVHLFSLLQESLNFSVEWVHVDDNSYGGFDSKSNSWNGVVGMIERNEIDTSIVLLSVTTERTSVISYSISIQEFSLGLFLQKPGASWSWTTFLDVFNNLYWLVLWFTISLFSIYLYFLSIYSNKDQTSAMTRITNIGHFFVSVAQCVMVFLAFNTTELSNNFSRLSRTKRVITLIMHFCGMLNYYVYVAALVSYLMVQRYDLPINDLDDILLNPGFKLIVLKGSNVEHFLKYSENPNFRKIWENSAQGDGLITDNEKGLNQVLLDKHKVLFGMSPHIEFTSDSYPCRIVKTRRRYNPHSAAYPFNKKSKYIEIFNYQIGKILERGLETEEMDTTKKDEIQCEKQTEHYFRTLSYKDVNFAFLIFMLGCLLAFGYLMTESLRK